MFQQLLHFGVRDRLIPKCFEAAVRLQVANQATQRTKRHPRRPAAQTDPRNARFLHLRNRRCARHGKDIQRSADGLHQTPDRLRVANAGYEQAVGVRSGCRLRRVRPGKYRSRIDHHRRPACGAHRLNAARLLLDQAAVPRPASLRGSSRPRPRTSRRAGSARDRRTRLPRRRSPAHPPQHGRATFAGIRPGDAPGFILAQLAGAAAATLLFHWLVPSLPKDAASVVVPHSSTTEASV